MTWDDKKIEKKKHSTKLQKPLLKGTLKNFKSKNLNDITKEVNKMMLLLRRVYNLIELSHLNDFKLIPTYCQHVRFPRDLGEKIFNYLQTKDENFYNFTIKRQKRYRNRLKRLQSKPPKYLIRPTDYTLFSLNDNATTYDVHENKEQFVGNGFSLEVLLSHKFIPITELQIPYYQTLRDEYYRQWMEESSHGHHHGD